MVALRPHMSEMFETEALRDKPMSHHTPLITLIVAGLGLAFVFGALAQRLRLSPLVGYLIAGVVIGPFSPGFVADQGMANELAEIGVILLMFGVGLHFSFGDLLSVRTIAIPGAVVQIAVATLLGMGMAWWLGWSIGAGLVFGLALSVASTVVLLRALQERRLVETERGRIAVGWLIVEDIAMVLTLVMLPALAPMLKSASGAVDWPTLAVPLAITIAKVAAFVAIMLIVGKRVIPWLLHWVAHTGSRELFRLAVLAIALGCAFEASVLFDVSFALGAFFAGMIMSESQLSQRAANETLPLRDAFAVLFFVSVGMLVDPMIVVREPVAVLATVLIIVVGKSLAAYLIVRLFQHPHSTALTISASLAQIGEFSFILAGLGVALALLPERGRDLILAGAIISILLNPLLFALLDRILAPRPAASPAAPDAKPGPAPEPAREEIPLTALTDHVVLVGHGRVGSFVSEQLMKTGTPLLVIEEDADRVDGLKGKGPDTIAGNGADPDVLHAARLEAARCILVAVPDAFEGGQIVAQARERNAALPIVARAHSEEEIEHLKKHGATQVVMGEHEIAKAMIAAVPPVPPAGTPTSEPSPPVAPA
jgi:CPA2 family monovalent cation:H+ antiporter-2